MNDAIRIEPLDLAVSHLLVRDGRAEHVGGGGEFWQRLASDDSFAERIGHGWLVASFDMPETWTSWEVHPDGDEIVYVESGRLRLVTEIGDELHDIDLAARQAVVIPAGVWHTVDVIEPARTLNVTFGRDTGHRPR